MTNVDGQLADKIDKFLEENEQKTKTNSEVIMIDGIMGSGKTSYIINHMNDNPKEKWIYVGVLLSECERIKNACPRLNFKNTDNKNYNTKTQALIDHLKNGDNIVTTHALMSQYSSMIEPLLKDYNIVFDEEFQCIDNAEIKAQELKAMRPNNGSDCTRNKIIFDENGIVSWNYSYFPNPEENCYPTDLAIKRRADQKRLYCFDESFFVWIMPLTIFTAPKKVYCLSYMIKYSFLYRYLIKAGIKVKCLDLFKEYEAQIKNRAKELITIADISAFKSPDLKKHLEKRTFLSMNSFKTGESQSKCTPELRKKISTAEKHFLQKQKIKCDSVLSTTYKEWCHAGKKGAVQGMGIPSYQGSWVSKNCRGTNDYADKTTVIYNVNVFPNATWVKYINHGTVDRFDCDKWALAEMLQFVWRSAIRKEVPEPITLIIPSARMKNLFLEWLNS